MSSNAKPSMAEMRGTIAAWFEESCLIYNKIERLRDRDPAFHTLNERRFRDWIRLGGAGPSGGRQPQQRTLGWIYKLHSIVNDPHQREELDRYLGALRVHNRPFAKESPPLPTPNPSTASQRLGLGPAEMCAFNVALACQGMPYAAWRQLMDAFKHYADRQIDVAMELVPTQIYLGYRYLGVEQLSRTAGEVLKALAKVRSVKCEAATARMAMFQLGVALTERGQGVTRSAITHRA